MHSMKVGPTASQRMSVSVRCSGALGQHQERAGHHQIVALDKANEGKHGDYQYVVAAERDAVELASENVTGG